MSSPKVDGFNDISQDEEIKRLSVEIAILELELKKKSEMLEKKKVNTLWYCFYW